MTIKKSDRDMLVRRDAEGREEFVAWGRVLGEIAAEKRFLFKPIDMDEAASWYFVRPFAVIPRDRIEVTDDVADLGPGWRVRWEDARHPGVENEGTVYIGHDRWIYLARGWPLRDANSLLRAYDEPGRLRILSAWRVLPETPSEVELLADKLASVPMTSEGREVYLRRAAEHLHALGYRKTGDGND